MGIIVGRKPIVENGLVFCVDVLSKDSYIGSGTTINDIVGSFDGTSVPSGTLTNSSISTSPTPHMLFDGSGYLQLSGHRPTTLHTNSNTLEIWFQNNTSATAKMQLAFSGTSGSTYAPGFIAFTNETTSSNSKGYLSFGTRVDETDAAPSERMRIDSTGTVFIGVTSSSGFNGAVWKDADGISLYRANATGGNAAMLVYSDEGSTGANKGYWKCNGGIVNYQSNDGDLSDERLKKDIVDTPSCYDTIKALKVRNYKYKTDEDSYKTHVGLIAQETEAIDSSLVNTTDGLYGFEEEQESTVKEANGTVIATSVEEADWIQGKTDGIYPSDSTWTENERYKTIYTKDLYFKMLKALQESMTKIETLETKVTALENA